MSHIGLLLLVGRGSVGGVPGDSSSGRRSDHVEVTKDGSQLLEGEALGLLEEEVGDDGVGDVGGDEDEEAGEKKEGGREGGDSVSFESGCLGNSEVRWKLEKGN